MDTSVYIFIILLDVFIVFTIFAVYLYLLFRYFLHNIEVNSINSFFNMHLQIYKPILTIIKQFTHKISNNNIYNINIDSNNNIFENTIQKYIDNSTDLTDPNTFSIGTIIILTTIIGLFLIVLIYFGLFYKKIITQVSLINILFTVFINLIFIIGFELLFVFFVYSNIDVVNIQYVLGL